MKILSMETSSNICSVAILEDNEVIKEISICDENTHSQKLMPLVSQIFEQTNLSLEDIDLFACDKGPGSFTGIRIGIATLKAFSDVSSKPIIGISSLDALAHNITTDGYICSLIDAKHDNVYCCIYQLSDNIYTKIQDYSFNNIHELAQELSKYNNLIFFVGNGSILYKDVLQSELKEKAIINEDSSVHSINAINICKVAFQGFLSNSNKNFFDVEPLYIKKSSAEISLEEKSNAN